MTRPFEARYPGVCSDCEEPIRPGEQIVSLGGGEYEHVTSRPPDRPAVVYATCWLTICDCEDTP